jgi:O-antigen/teichoic acid export membrane protein
LLEPHIQESGITVTEKSAAALPIHWVQRLLGADRSVLLKRLTPWVSRGGLAILDQGLISGSNFLISVLLARWLVPEQYGAYAVAFGIYILLSLVYQALVLEPMAVYGGSSYRNCLRGYLGSLLWIHIAVSVFIFAVFGASALAAREVARFAGLAGALAGVTIACPFILAFGLARRSFYLQLSPAKAVIGSFVYSASSIAGLFVLYRRGLLSAFAAFLLMGLASLLTGIYLFARLRAGLAPSTFAPTVRDAWRRHWSYGRWALASSIASWIPAYIYYSLLSSFGRMAQSGQLKALMNFTQPMEQIRAALGLLLLPYAAGVQDREGRASAKTLSIRMTLVSLGGALVYWAVVLPLQRPTFHFLYSGRYMDVVHLLPSVALGSIVWSAAYGPAIALRAMESPDSVFTAFAIATVLSLLVGVPATWFFGLKGAIWGGNLADILSLVIVVWILRRKIHSHSVLSKQVPSWNGPDPQTLPAEVPTD